jgi:hypothetical protein
MAAYVFESVERRLTPHMIRQVSAFLDERPSSTRRAVAIALPALLAGLIERASSARGAETLLNVIHRVGLGLDLDELSRGGGSYDDLHRAGRSVVATILGGRSGDVVALMADESDLRLSSAADVLELLALVVIAVIGRDIARHGLDEAALMLLLSEQQHDVSRGLSVGLSL